MKRKTNEKGRGVTSMKLNILSRITWPSYVLRGSLSLSFSLLFRLSRTSRKSCNDRGERFSKNTTPLIARYNRSAHLAERTVLPLRCGKKTPNANTNLPVSCTQGDRIFPLPIVVCRTVTIFLAGHRSCGVPLHAQKPC